MIPDANFTITKAKAHLRVDHSAEDAVILAALDAAVMMVEQLTRRAWTKREWSVAVDSCDLGSCGCDSHVFHAELSPATVKAFNTTGTPEVELTSVVVSTQYGHTVARVNDWTAEPDTGNVGRLDWIAEPPGGRVPAAIYQAVMLYLGDFYDNRDAQVIGTIVAQNEHAALLVRPYVLDLHL